ncbi:MAG: nucleoside deaminase [Planctomycetota bacterium]
MNFPVIHIEYPKWVSSLINWNRTYLTDQDKMELAIQMSRENVLRETGGPFGAAIFERTTGKLVSVGMNLVVPLNNCTLHGEMVAFMMAQARLRSFTLAADGFPAHELFTSCDPCAMCLGATLWSGVTRMVCGATRDDAMRFQFDEGPVFPESYQYLEKQGIKILHGVQQKEAVEVLALYLQKTGLIYNGIPRSL